RAHHRVEPGEVSGAGAGVSGAGDREGPTDSGRAVVLRKESSMKLTADKSYALYRECAGDLAFSPPFNATWPAHSRYNAYDLPLLFVGYSRLPRELLRGWFGYCYRGFECRAAAGFGFGSPVGCGGGGRQDGGECVPPRVGKAP